MYDDLHVYDLHVCVFVCEIRIFGRTLSLILENIENYLLSCYDVVGLLIMIKVD
jgi:hypothetical protein